MSRRMRVLAAGEHGVGAEQLRGIGTDPELFEAFYREQVEDLQRFVARRVGDRERAADLTAEVFLAAVESAHRYRARRGSPKAWLYGIARIVVAGDRRRRGRELVALDDLSVAEAAAAAAVRPVTARVRLHRARRKLRTELEAATPTPETPTEERGS